MVFPQGEDQGQVVPGELVVKGGPILKGAPPLPDHRVIPVGEALFQALFGQPAQGRHALRKGRDHAVGQGKGHGLQQEAPCRVLLLQRVAGCGTAQPQVQAREREAALRLAHGQRGLRHRQHGVGPVGALQIFGPQVQGVDPVERRHSPQIPLPEPLGGHIGSDAAHGRGGQRELRDSGDGSARMRLDARLEEVFYAGIGREISQADGRRHGHGANPQPGRVVAPALMEEAQGPLEIAPKICQLGLVMPSRPDICDPVQDGVGMVGGQRRAGVGDEPRQIGGQPALGRRLPRARRGGLRRFPDACLCRLYYSRDGDAPSSPGTGFFPKSSHRILGAAADQVRVRIKLPDS